MWTSTSCAQLLVFFFFFNDTATTEIYTLSLHDALPVSPSTFNCNQAPFMSALSLNLERSEEHTSNSSHTVISYAVFCLKKKKKEDTENLQKKNKKIKMTIKKTQTKK